MAEYITKEQVIEWFRPYGHTDEGVPYYGLVTDIREMKSADVAPVVRCRDCKHSYEDLGGLCCSYGPCVDCPVPPDFWCANGRRREDDHAQD